MVQALATPLVLEDGTVYSVRKGHCPLSIPPVETYALIIGDERMERVLRTAEPLKGLKLLGLNATAQGGGVAEMLFSALPFLNALGVAAEWKTVKGNTDFFDCTKRLHNLMQGMRGSFTPEMEKTYYCTLEECAGTNLIDYDYDVVDINDPQPLGLTRYLRTPHQKWLWRCHIDVEETTLRENPALWDFLTESVEQYDAAIFSAAQYVMASWRLPKYIIPPFIDPLSEKNRELTEQEISAVLAKYDLDPRIPMIVQVGRYDPWKGLDRTIATFRNVRKMKECQLVLAGGHAADDPQGEKILGEILEATRKDEDIHVLKLSLEDRVTNHREVNALQRAASVIMQPSTREGFGLVITEALWKSKPVIASDIGGIPLQIRDHYNGYFYETPKQTAQRVIYLLEHPKTAQIVGARGRSYVAEHFLMPDRIADYLKAITMIRQNCQDPALLKDLIVSFHPWYGLRRRSR